MKTPTTDLRKLSRSLAANNLRVMNFLDGLVSRVDDVVDATFERNWDQVIRISQLIARYSELRGFSAIAQSATSVNLEAEGRCDETELRRRVLSLVNACGQARRKQREAAEDVVTP